MSLDIQVTKQNFQKICSVSNISKMDVDMKATEDKPRSNFWKEFGLFLVLIFIIIIALIFTAACIYIYVLIKWHLNNLSKSNKM